MLVFRWFYLSSSLACTIMLCECISIINYKMDKLMLVGQNLGQVVNFRHGRGFVPCISFVILKQASLKWKTAQTTLRFSPVGNLSLVLVCFWQSFMLSTTTIFRIHPCFMSYPTWNNLKVVWAELSTLS